VAIEFYTFVSGFLDKETAGFWEGSLVKKIDVYKEKMLWILYVSIEKPLPVKIVHKTSEKLCRAFDFLDEVQIILHLKNFRQNIDSIITERRDDLSSCLFSGNNVIESIEWQVGEDRLDLIAGDESAYNYIIEKEICTGLSAWFMQEYFLRVLVRALCSKQEIAAVSSNDFILRKEVEVMEVEEDRSNNKRRHIKKEKKDNKLLNAKVIKISELEEGSRDAVIEGEVWKKDINNIKGGRYVISYYLTDYTDTVIVKSFVDKIKDDQINAGDFIRVRGSVRYDDYVKEIVLSLDSYVVMKKTERVDTCEEKRIELHAHTKMSAMDGLTEINELVKRAAEWKHPAIAITDHGGVQAFPDAYHAAGRYNIKVIYGVEAYLVEEDKKERPYHIVLLARNLTGLKNMYHLVSISYIDYFYRRPKVPREELSKYREGLLLGTACEAGELYRAIINGAEEKEIESIASFYDYLEIQPVQNNEFLIRDGRVENEDHLRRINQSIVELGKKLNKPVAATGDVHFLDPHHEIFRRIIQAGQGYEDAEAQAPLYFRTTDEMLEEFAYLGDEDAKMVVIDNPMVINEMIENIKPVPDGFYPPKIDTAEEEITELTWKNAHALYGDDLPALVEERIVHELDSITRHGFSVLYLIAHKLVKKSNEDGYLVGSRGSVGSSLVAYFTGITEVNPLKPHYLCSECSYSEFVLDGSAGCGADLEDKNCPVCGKVMCKDGFDIPFETFLGFEGDKVPDIDLNFSGDYQGCAHQYVEELFGRENVFRAGTISTIAEKTAYGFVKNYADSMQIVIKNSEINRLVKGITGVRRTTGQHPGGLIVVPRDRDILEFTPLQHPADNKDSGVITTHFEYHAIGDQLVKLDILGHDDPTVIKELEDLTGIKASSISLSEKETMKIFSGVEPLGVTPEDIDSTVGTYGIPEFGTRFVRQMLEATRPTTFSELVRISGLSHGTNVWLNNARDLIRDETATLGEVICTRDDIMTYLIQQGIKKKQAFKIMEKVRKGRGLSSDEADIMSGCDVPSWYIDSCNKIEYMFPKAHAVAYVTMAYRIAYFKVYYPLQFYASFFSIRAEDFDSEIILKGYDSIKRRIKEINNMGNSASQKEKKLLPVLEVAMEACVRGVKFYPVDIYKSRAEKFVVCEDGLLLPFSALPNVGVTAAKGIEDSQAEGEYLSIEEFQKRTHLNKTAMDIMRKNGCFKDLPESSQLSLFG